MTTEYDNAFIPEQLFVTYSKQKDDNSLLGFMSPYGTDSGAKKRIKTQMDWAYSSWRNVFDYKELEDGSYQFYNRDDKDQTPIEIEEEIKPKILDNIIQSGFKVSEAVRRHYWGGGNVVWRIQDPRGFELEITSGNMAKIISESIIENGVIQSDCIWARMAAQNLLVPCDTEMYKHISKKTQQRKQIGKLTLKDISPGNVVEIYKKDAHYTYYGSLNVVYSHTNFAFLVDNITLNSDYKTFRKQFIHSQNKRYVFIDELTKEVILLTTPKIVAKHSDDVFKCSKAELIKKLNYRIRELKFKLDYYSEDVSLFSEKPITQKDVVLSLTPISSNDPLVNTNFFDVDYNFYDIATYRKFPITKLNLTENEIQLKVEGKHLLSHRYQNHIISEPITQIPEQKFQLALNFNNQSILQNFKL